MGGIIGVGIAALGADGVQVSGPLRTLTISLANRTILVGVEGCFSGLRRMVYCPRYRWSVRRHRLYDHKVRCA